MDPVRTDLPSGTVTFLFTDVEGSTKLLNALGPDEYAAALAEHRRILRAAFSAHGGVEVDTQGDALFVAFPAAPSALTAAAEARDGLASGPIRVRIGLHTGTPQLTAEGYVGSDVHRAARIAAAGHGGQILLSSSTAALVSSPDLRDLGEHRLKDLSAPERIYQFGSEEHSPLDTLHQTNLPVPATPFLGREEEVRDIASLLVRDDIRLVTLTGPGGTGKTRLALQAAASVAGGFPGGVWWVPLASLRDSQLVLETAAKALGASSDLAEHIADSRLLVLFDNFEHLIEAAGDLAQIIERAANLTIMVTSREPLRLDGEWEWAVDPLRDAEAAELFATRARAVRRDFSASDEVAQICTRLDNLPLAIELAAARIKLLTPQALLARLEQHLPVLAGAPRDAPQRQRTLHATIAWSYELLSDDEQQLFAGLSVFRGGCTLRAAESIVDADLDTLQSLVDKSLVRARTDRFSMLETIREYAEESLGRREDASNTLRRHGEYYLGLAEEAGPALWGSTQADWLALLDSETPNIRAALTWAREHNAYRALLRAAVGLWRFWEVRGQLSEGRRWLERSLEHDLAPTTARVDALAAAGTFARHQGDLDAAESLSRAGYEIARELGYLRGQASALTGLATVASLRRDTAGAMALQEEAITLLRTLQDLPRLAIVVGNLGYMALMNGEAAKALPLFEESRDLSIQSGSTTVTANLNVGFAALMVEDRERAIPALCASLEEAVQLKHVEYLAYAAQGLAALAVERDPRAAGLLLGAADGLLQRSGARRDPVEQVIYERTMEAIASRLSAEHTSQALADGETATDDEIVAFAERESNLLRNE